MIRTLAAALAGALLALTIAALRHEFGGNE